jgi:hypothetical protein
MNAVRCPYFYLACVLIVLSLFPSNVICGDTEEKYKPDQALAEASCKKAKELGHNPILLFVDEGRNIMITSAKNCEVIFNIGNSQFEPVENDMLINVGEIPFPIDGINLSKGEYAVVKGGKIVKQIGKITSD